MECEKFNKYHLPWYNVASKNRSKQSKNEKANEFFFYTKNLRQNNAIVMQSLGIYLGDLFNLPKYTSHAYFSSVYNFSTNASCYLKYKIWMLYFIFEILRGLS